MYAILDSKKSGSSLPGTDTEYASTVVELAKTLARVTGDTQTIIDPISGEYFGEVSPLGTIDAPPDSPIFEFVDAEENNALRCRTARTLYFAKMKVAKANIGYAARFAKYASEVDGISSAAAEDARSLAAELEKILDDYLHRFEDDDENDDDPAPDDLGTASEKESAEIPSVGRTRRLALIRGVPTHREFSTTFGRRTWAQISNLFNGELDTLATIASLRPGGSVSVFGNAVVAKFDEARLFKPGSLFTVCRPRESEVVNEDGRIVAVERK